MIAIAQVSGGATEEELGTAQIYFRMVAPYLTPENFDLWLEGKKAPSLKGPIFAPSYDT